MLVTVNVIDVLTNTTITVPNVKRRKLYKQFLMERNVSGHVILDTITRTESVILVKMNAEPALMELLVILVIQNTSYNQLNHNVNQLVQMVTTDVHVHGDVSHVTLPVLLATEDTLTLVSLVKLTTT